MEVDNTKRMIFADIKVYENGTSRGTLSPAKFIYKKMPESPTTEVSMLHSIRDDLYIVVGTVNPQTKMASLQIHLNPLVGFIWFGCIILICGSFICMWPELRPQESRAWQFARGSAAVAASTMLGILLAIMPHPAFAQQTSSSLHSGTVRIENEKERELFGQVRCMCGTCARDLLTTCACSTAEDARNAIRAKLRAGETRDQILLAYQKEYGSESMAIPPNTGAMRAIYAVPLAAILGGGVGLGVLLHRWRAKSKTAPVDAGTGNARPRGATGRDEYDARLDEELKDLDG